MTFLAGFGQFRNCSAVAGWAVLVGSGVNGLINRVNKIKVFLFLLHSELKLQYTLSVG